MIANRRPGLSLCCLTSTEPAMVARTMAACREIADDIVVAVDSRVDPARLGPLVDVTDTLLRFEFIDPPERARPWLVALCRNKSVLMIDGDEVPSVALVNLLPTLVADRSVVQFRLARHWCFPDERFWLAERPWWPDYQRRLVRTGPFLDFDLQVHGGVRDALPARYVHEPLYHLACVIRSFTERRQRVREYVALRPGLVAVGGGPMNETLFVPEHFATLKPAPTPEEDVALLRSVLASAAPGARPACKSPDVPLVTADEVARHVPADPLLAQGYRARLQIVERDRRTEPGNNTLMVFEIANVGTAPILCEDRPGSQVRLAVRLVDPGTGAAVGGWALTPLPCDIPPGETRFMEGLIQIPTSAAPHTIEFDLVNQRGRWFGCGGRADLLVASRWGRFAP